MSRVSKALVLLGAVSMVATPAIASASGSTLPVMMVGGNGANDGDDENTGLWIGGVFFSAAIIAGILASGKSKSK